MRTTTAQAIIIANKFEEFLVTKGYHVALGGSCLHKGYSDKDVDLIVLPHNTSNSPTLALIVAEIENFIKGSLENRDHTHYQDDKLVMCGTYNGVRIDFFFLL